MKILVTGAAGFIGNALTARLLQRGDEVVGIDNLNDYYDVQLKEARLARLQAFNTFNFSRLDIADSPAMMEAFQRHRPDRVAHLAAQAGVRHSLTHPHVYITANVQGFLNVLEGCRAISVQHLVYASTSSVYGSNTHMPFDETQNVDHPLTLYAATKRSNELMAHAYSHLFSIPATGLRFFTVYGPWGRPDMALFLFTRNIIEGKPIDVFNHGHHTRDFTYVDDIVEGIIRALDRPAAAAAQYAPSQPDPSISHAPHRIYNIGSNAPTQLLRYIELIEQKVGRKAIKRLQPLQPGDIPDTHASVDRLMHDLGYAPTTPIEVGVGRFVDWYRDYYRI